MNFLEPQKPLYLSLRTLKSLGLLVFLTAGLTNCGQKGPKNDIQQEFEEPFQTDDISAIPLEESDLEALAKQEPTYQLIEAPFFLVDKPEEKYFGKIKSFFVYKKEEKIFESNTESEIKEEGAVKSLKTKTTFQSESPFEVINVEYEFHVDTLETKSRIFELNHYFNCQSINCTLTGTVENKITKEAKPITRVIPKTQLIMQDLKMHLLPQLIARHKFDMDRIRLSDETLVPEGKLNTKYVFYFNDPTGNKTLKYSKVIKGYSPDTGEYSLSKRIYSIDRDGKPLSSSEDFIKYESVNANKFETTMLYPIKRAETFQVEKVPSKKIEFAHAIVKGPGRHLLKNTRFQRVSHFANHSEVELYGENSGSPDNSTPTAIESTNKKEHYVEPEWQKEILSTIKNQTFVEDKALSILKFLTTQIRWTKTNANLNFKEIFDLKRGDCSEFAKTFVLFARENGIPARKHKGYFIPQDPILNAAGELLDKGSAHAWANYFSLDSNEWIYADAALRLHKNNRYKSNKKAGIYLLDFGVDSSSDIELEDYNHRPLLLVRFVFDKVSEEAAIKELSKP